MKKVVCIFLSMVFVVLVTSIALGEIANEVIDFCNENESLKIYIREDNDTYGYNIVGDCAYVISNIGSEFKSMYDFMERYEKDYLKENFPDFAKDVKIEFTYTGSTENYEIICVWLKLDNGKVMKDYLDSEPDVTEMSGIVYFLK